MKQKKRRKNYLIILGILVLTAVYGVRVAYVNQDNDKTKIHYVTDDAPVEVQGLEITIEEEKLYETAAFVGEFPSVRRNFQYQGSFFEQHQDEEGLRAIEYILYVKMRFKNVSDELQPIPYNDYHIYGGVSYNNGVNPFLLGDLNQVSGVSLKPGSSYFIMMAYEMNRLSFHPDRYQKLLEQDFSIIVSGYPDICHIRLSHLEPVKADREARDIYENLVSADKSKAPVLPNTRQGIIMDIGETYVTNGVMMTVEDYDIVDNLNDYDYKKLGAAEDDGIPDITHYTRKDGSVKPRRLEKGKGYFVFVTLRCQNTTEAARGFSLSPYLYNYTGKASLEDRYVWLGEQFQHEKYSATYMMEAHGDDTVTVAYHITADPSLPKKLWWDFDKPLYLSFGIMDPGKVDLPKGNPGTGIFLRIK